MSMHESVLTVPFSLIAPWARNIIPRLHRPLEAHYCVGASVSGSDDLRTG